MDLDEVEPIWEAGISGVEDSEDNNSRVELVVELADTTDDEDKQKPTTLAHTEGCAGSEGGKCHGMFSPRYEI